jgi:alkyl hydroperoxide reductase subunit F
MLDQGLKEQIRTLFESLKSDYRFDVEVASGHPAKDELLELLNEVASCSSKVSVSIAGGDGLRFVIIKDGIPSSFVFRTVPNGHEFSSLLLAILNLDGSGKNLPDAFLTQRIRSLPAGTEVKSYISLTCTNCPDVVQALNLISIINPSVHHEIIDGGINRHEVEALNIQAVPSVYADGELLHVGRSSLGELLEKLEEKSGSAAAAVSSGPVAYDVVVAGGGPSGVAAAIYSARKGLKVAVVAERMGGQLTETVGIENMISVSKTTGKLLASNLRDHLGSYPVDIFENRHITALSLENGMKRVTTSLGEVLETPALIIATGASWRRLNVPGESRYIGSGVAFCAHCDGPFYKNKKVAVIGGGNSGLEAAIDLSAIASEVTVLEFNDELKGDDVLQKKVLHIPNVKVLTGVETLSVDGDDSKVNGLTFRHRATGDSRHLELDGVFIQIGLKANSDTFAPLVETSPVGEIRIDAHCRTNVAGIYAAGDVTTVPFKQIIIAMGEGSKAALSAFEDKLKDKLLAS